MPKTYAREPPVKKNAVKAKGTDLRVSFKNTFNTAKAVRTMTLNDAKAYLNQCLEKQRCIPMRKFCGSQGRHAQAKEFGLTKGRWPTKSIKVVIGLIDNMIANATVRNFRFNYVLYFWDFGITDIFYTISYYRDSSILVLFYT